SLSPLGERVGVRGIPAGLIDLNPSPHPSPSRSRIYPTSATLKCRTRVNPSSDGRGSRPSQPREYRPIPTQFQNTDDVVDAIIARVGKRIVLALPLGLGKANHVANALFARAAADPSIQLHIFTALTLEKPHAKPGLERRFLAPFAERVFGGYPDLAYALALHRGALPANIAVDEFFFQAGSRLNVPASQQSYISANYTHALRYVLDRGVNVVAQLVARRERDGETRFSLSCNPDLTLDLMAIRARGQCDFLSVAQVNSELPFMPG